MIGVTLDAGALIALERSDRRVIALLARATATDAAVTIPAAVVAQVIRDPARQVRTSKLIRQPNTRLPALDAAAAIQVGRLLAASRTSDVVDAHVVLCAREAEDSIVTTDPLDLARLDPNARLVVL
jgi:predicted nucleic acid-binding protein